MPKEGETIMFMIQVNKEHVIEWIEWEVLIIINNRERLLRGGALLSKVKMFFMINYAKYFILSA